MIIDMSQLPLADDGEPCDFVIGSTNGGLTVHAKIGNTEVVFEDTIQEAVDKAIYNFKKLNGDFQ